MKNNRSFRLGRRIMGLALAVCFAFGGAVTAWADAVSTYTVSVSNGQLSILKGGYVTNTFRTNSNNATVATGTDGNLMVCFYDANNKYVGVTLGSQQIVNFYGSIGTLTLDSSLDRLQTDMVDLYYLHRTNGGVSVEEVAEAMGLLIEDGLIRGWGGVPGGRGHDRPGAEGHALNRQAPGRPAANTEPSPQRSPPLPAKRPRPDSPQTMPRRPPGPGGRRSWTPP